MKNYHELQKLNPLQSNRTTDLTPAQKALAISKATPAKRKPKTVDYLTVPELALSKLEELYSGKYNGTKGNHSFRLDLYRLFLHIIYNTHRQNLESQEAYFPLHSQILKNLMGRNKEQGNYAAIRADLIEWKYIEFDKNYTYNSAADIAAGIVKEVACQKYRLTERIRTGNFVAYRARGIKYSEKTEKHLEARTTSLLLDESQPQYAWLKANLSRLSMAPAAYDWIAQQQAVKAPLKDKEVRNAQGDWKKLTNRYVSAEIANYYRASIDEINNRKEDGSPFFKVIPTNNRLDTSLTHLNSSLRQFVQVDGVSEDLQYIDLSSSQVYLLLPLLKSTQAIQHSNGKEFRRFSDLVLAGDFYNDLVTLMEAKSPEFEAEGDAKVNFFKFVIYSNTHKSYGFRRYFNLLFPAINQAILELVGKAKDKEEGLAIQLQKLEASLFLDKICLSLYRQLGKDSFIATLHDGILCEAKDFDTVYNTMLETLTAATGLTPHLKAGSFQHPKKKTVITKDNWLTAAFQKQTTLELVAALFEPTPDEEAQADTAVQELLTHWLKPPAPTWQLVHREFLLELQAA